VDSIATAPKLDKKRKIKNILISSIIFLISAIVITASYLLSKEFNKPDPWWKEMIKEKCPSKADGPFYADRSFT